ncbi:MAG TPA: response regulator [Beijerinckiaceae bacterium]|jgi:CheY-like chemotaxis protein
MSHSSRIPVVLVVEDEFLVRMSTSEMLADAGYEVLEAENAREALAVLGDRSDIDLLFTDVMMPGELDGLGLASLVRERLPHVQVIVTSAVRIPVDERLPEGSTFVGKPYEMNGLMALFEKTLAHAAAPVIGGFASHSSVASHTLQDVGGGESAVKHEKS